jgi:hypothetical protein
MRRRFVFILLIMFSVVSFAFAARVASLPDLLTPLYLAVDDQQFYVVDRAVVYIYSLEEFSLKAKFGKAGEGPQEFKVTGGGEGVFVYPQKDVLVVNSPGKLSFYSKDGKFIKEMKTPTAGPSQGSPMFQPIDGKFVGMGMAMDQESSSMSFTLNLYTSQLDKTKELKRIKFIDTKRRKMIFPPVSPAIYVWDNKIITVGEKEGISINIYDADGNKVLSIDREYKKLKMTETFKEKTYQFFKTMPDTKQYFDVLKQMIEFKDYFPAIQIFWVVDGRIYIQTFREKDRKYEFFVFDFKGKLLKHVFLPVAYMYGNRITPTAIKNDKFYQVVENEDEEVWELHITPIK